MSNSIKLLKQAAASQQAGAAVAKLIKALGKGSVAAVRGGANVGGGVAQGLGASPGIGKVVGGAGVVGAGAAGGKKLDDERRKWLYRHNFARYHR